MIRGRAPSRGFFGTSCSTRMSRSAAMVRADRVGVGCPGGGSCHRPVRSFRRNAP
ncbi:hypothetical protein BZL30_4604 [Mycobacterium kansasii]|uniref:Uncharacterized protein n=1 Tax=Mycobacterium kansasii TaxID=1768 RepID=A0A1V3X636_MYCKA|nr:hypothetical protein BZL30_4604 [Mycobacterium kansasii]